MTEQGQGIISLWNCRVGDLRQRSLELESSQVTGLTPWLLGNAKGSFIAQSVQELISSAGKKSKLFTLFNTGLLYHQCHKRYSFSGRCWLPVGS